MSDSVVLGGIRYSVSVQDGQVIFEEMGGIWGTHSLFAFEKTKELNGTPGIWYFVEMDDSCNRIPARHIVQAYEWCCEHFGKNFETAKV